MFAVDSREANSNGIDLLGCNLYSATLCRYVYCCLFISNRCHIACTNCCVEMFHNTLFIFKAGGSVMPSLIALHRLLPADVGPRCSD